MVTRLSKGASPGAPCPHCGVKHRTITADQCEDRNMSEATLQSRVIAQARRRHWKVAHAGKGWVGDMDTGIGQYVTPMSPGWPDLMLFNPKASFPVVAMELKREEGIVSPEQVEWLDLMARCGIPAVIVRPSDLRAGRVRAILAGR